MTTATEPVVVEAVTPKDASDEYFRSSLCDAVQVGVPVIDAIMDASDPDRPEHPAVYAWDALADEIVDELAPVFAKLIAEAYERRLPWTWEPER